MALFVIKLGFSRSKQTNFENIYVIKGEGNHFLLVLEPEPDGSVPTFDRFRFRV